MSLEAKIALIVFLAGPLVADQPNRLDGVVLDGQGRPVVGAFVRVLAASGELLASTSSVQDGTFAVENVIPSNVRVTVEKVSFCAASLEVPAPGRERLSLRVLPLGGVRGVVLSDAETPIRNASVELVRSAERPSSCAVKNGRWTAATNELGSFSLSDVPIDGVLRLRVKHPRFISQERVLEPSDLVGKPDITYKLKAGAELAVHVTDFDGKPVAQGEASLVGAASGITEKAALDVGGDGNVSLGGVVPGTYRFRIVAPGYVPYTIDGLVLRAGETKRVGPIRLRAGHSLEGILQTDLTSCKGLTVSAFSRADGTAHLVQTVDVAADCRFLLSQLQRGSYDVRIFAPQQGEILEVSDLETGRPSTEIRLPSSFTVDGSVTRDDELPLEGVSVEIRRVGAPGSLGKMVGHPRVNPETGAFSMILFSGFQYHAVARAPRSAPAVSAFDASSSRNIELKLTRGSTLIGVVLDASTARPVPQAVVACDLTDPLSACNATSSADGEFRLLGLPRGQRTLIIEHPGYVKDRYTVTLSGDEISETFLLAPGTKLEGFVRYGDGRPVAGVALEVARHGTPPLSAVTDEVGHYVFEAVPSGAVAVRRLGAFGSVDDVESRIVVVTSGETAREDFVVGTTVMGVVTKQGQPVPGARVSISTSAGDSRALSSDTTSNRTTWTDESGSYGLADVSPGTVTVAVSDRNVLTTRTAVVPATADYRYDIELNDAHLTGFVLDARETAPIAGATVLCERADSANPWMILQSSDAREGDELLVSGTGQFARAVTAADGSFALPAPKSARLRLTVRAEGFLPLARVIDGSVEAITLELRRGAKLEARLVEPVGPGTLLFGCLLGSEVPICVGAQGTVLRFQEVPEGAYELAVAASNRGVVSIQPVTLSAGSLNEEELPTIPSHVSRLQIPDQAQARILALLRGKSDYLPLLRMAGMAPAVVTDESTRFVRITGLPMGDYQVVFASAVGPMVLSLRVGA
ncbi:MAG TPA: carboxypeptidase regulatory-like domain-containing protein [Candidatus Polarisedimenticolaceae bacterium]|nr:carboxypeptidase regulatory-like domain-containing protein [Candidatus Polarisedimenticolaceae bacterium]